MVEMSELKLAVRGLYNHALKRQYDPEGVQGLFRIMVKTNFAAADAVNLVHRVFVPKRRFDDTKGVLGPISRERRRDIVGTLRRDGFYVFPEVVPSDILDAITRMMDSTPGLLYPALENGPERAIHNPQAPQAPAYYYREAFPPEMQQIMADENFTALATDYLGVDPVLHTCQQWTSTAGAGPSSPLAQLYHFDISSLKWLNVFIYLTDVTTDTGPHCLIKGSHRAEDKVGAHLRARGAARYTDEEVLDVYGADRHVEISGRRGTVLCVDTRLCHKGKHPTAGDRRIMSNYYVNSTFGIPGQVVKVENPTPEFLAAGKQWPRLFHNFPTA